MIFKNRFVLIFVLFIVSCSLLGQSIQRNNSIISSFKSNIYGLTDSVSIDTGLVQFQQYPYYFWDFSANLGNTHSPHYSLRFKPYLGDENEIPTWISAGKEWESDCFYHTHKHFTLINYFTNWKKQQAEQGLSFIHTQNINAKLNVGIQGGFFASSGKYQNQENRDNSVRFFSSYNGNKYGMTFSYRLGKITQEQNGGIVNDALYLDSLYVPENIQVTLLSALTTLKAQKINFNHRVTLLGFGEYDTLTKSHSHSISIINNNFLSQYRKIYTDVPSSFYQNIYLDSSKTYDSLQIQYYKSDLLLNYATPKLSISGGIVLQKRNYGTAQIDTSFRGTAFTVLGNYKLKNTLFALKTDFPISGINSGLLSVEGIISQIIFPESKYKMAIHLEASGKSMQASFFDRYYISNHFTWNHSFSAIENKQISLKINEINHNILGEVSLFSIKNHIYFDTLAMPKQDTLGFQMAQYSLSKVFKLGHWAWTPVVLFQQAGNTDIIRLPAISTRQSVSYSRRVLKVLDIQLGFDFYYFTEFMGNAYMPSTGIFYLQNEKNVGGYPLFDAYLNAKLKRVRFNFKVNHVSDVIFPRNNFLVLHYPLPDRYFTFGISWSFYD